MREELSPCQCDIVVETKQKKTTKLLYIEGGSIAQFNTLPRFVRFARQWGNDLSK